MKIFQITIILIMLSVTVSCFGTDPFPYPLPGQAIGDEIGIRNSSFEPSGIVYHPVRDTLFVVCDDGNLAEISDTGALLNYWPSAVYTDREAVTYCPVNDALYTWNNEVKWIEEVDLTAPDTIAFIQTYSISSIVDTDNVEGMEFVPDGLSSEGGHFYLGVKADDGGETCFIRKVELPIVNTSGSIQLINQYPLARSNLSDLYYDSDRDILMAIYSQVPKILSEMTRECEIIVEYSIQSAGDQQEGFCEDDLGCAYIAEDNEGSSQGPGDEFGGVLRFYPRPGPALAPFPYEEPGVEITSEILAVFPGFEPSGIIYHPVRETLFVVDDNGNVAEITNTGSLVNYWYIDTSHRDREDITYSPVTGLIYLWSNRTHEIEEFDPSDTVPFSNCIKNTYYVGDVTDTTVKTEGLAFVSDASCSEGGYFYVGQRYDDNPTKVFKFQLPIVHPASGIHLIDAFGLGRSGLNGLWYDANNDILKAVYWDGGRQLQKLALNGEVLENFYMADSDWRPEGTCEDAAGNFYVAFDDNHVMKYSPPPPPTAVSHEKDPSITLKFDSVSGESYRVERATSLEPSNWTQIDSFTASGSQVSWQDRDSTSTGSASKLFYRFIYTGSTGTESKSFMTRYYGYGELKEHAPNKEQCGRGYGPIYVDGSETQNLVFKFDFDHSWTHASWQDAFAFPDRGNVISVSNLKIYDQQFRETYGAPVVDIYRLKREVEVLDFFEYAYNGEVADPEQNIFVDWNEAGLGDTWEIGGAKGASDRYATPLVDNKIVSDENPYDLDIPDMDAQWLVAVLNSGGNLSLLYELDSTSPSGAGSKVKHYGPCYKISFDYITGYNPSTTIDEITPSLTINFDSLVGKTYKIEWSDTPDTLPVEKWHEITTFTAEDTVTYWTDSGGDDREPIYHPSERYYQVWLMNP